MEIKVLQQSYSNPVKSTNSLLGIISVYALSNTSFKEFSFYNILK